MIQSVLFDKTKWKVQDAKKWLKERKFKYSKVHETDKKIRFRQFKPKSNAKYVTVNTKDGIQFIVLTS